MTETARLQNLLQQTYAGTCFHGDSIAQVLNGIDAAQAAWISENASHSIWQIVLHMTGWLGVIRERLTSPTLVMLSDEQNFPAVLLPTHENWSATREAFHAALAALIASVGKFPEAKLESQVPGKSYTFDLLLHGAIHHNLYHLGQISMLHAMYRRHHAVE
jgi:hypothetical protein